MTSPTPFLDKWYPNHKTHDRSRTLELIISDLWRQYPAWPSTFSACANDDCGNQARGGSLCPACVGEALSELAGYYLAGKYADTVRRCVITRTALYDAVREPEGGWKKP